MEIARPDPDELLQRLQLQDGQRARGRLRIYFGANAGVGKTYAMLSAAQREIKAGRGDGNPRGREVRWAWSKPTAEARRRRCWPACRNCPCVR